MRAERILLVVVTLLVGACADKPATPGTGRAEPAAVQTAGASPAKASAEADEVDDEVDDEDDAVFASALSGHKRVRYTEDLEGIKQRGVLRVISRNSSTSYFLHRGAEAGFNYELAKLFADELGLRLEMVVPRAPRDMVPWLLQGRGDIIIGSMPTDAPRASRVRMTRPYMQTVHVVVTRKGRKPALSHVDELRDVTLLVHPSSGAIKQLSKLRQASGVSFNVKASRETLHAEDLLDEVAEGRAEAAVVQKRIAVVELAHRDDLEIALELPTSLVESAFGVRPDDERLWQAADDFLSRHYRGTVFNILYARYHKPTKRSAAARNDEMRADKDGAFTEWDAHFQAAAKERELDWLLLVAQAFQESRLDPGARSQFGAQGLMQIMPETARELGVEDPFDPEQSIKGAALYMKKLVDRYDKEGVELKDRVRFALASYNVGPGHVDDARALAKEEGLDPDRWFDNVAKTMLLLSKPRYFKRARSGYCRGEEPVGYVSQIQARYDAYLAAAKAEPPQ